MAKIPSKGSVLQQTIAMSLTAVAQLTDIEIGGSQSETYKSTTLDGGVFHTYDLTGFSEPGTVTAGLFYDMALAGHQHITDQIATPAENAQKIIYADAATTEQPFTASGVTFGATIAMDDGVRGSATWQITGDPGWST